MAEGNLVFVVLEKRESTDPFSKTKHVSYYTYVMGDTYPFKDLLKKYGFWWNPERYLWMAEKDVAKQVAEELRNAGAEVMEVSRFYPEVWRMINQTEKINVDWNNNVHVIEFAPLEPNYVSVKSFKIPNNSVIVIGLTNKYAVIVSNDDGEFIETFEDIKKLNEYLRREIGIELNEPEGVINHEQE